MNAETLNQNAMAARRGRNFDYLTIGWYSLEAVVSVVAGLLAGSVALVGFGTVSVIEVSSGAIILPLIVSGEHREKNSP